MKEKRYIPVNKDLKLYVETYGEKGNETCLFISGAGANSSFWSDHLCDSLVKNGLFVIKYDHRDFGHSSKIDWDQNPYDFMELAKDALTILDSLDINKAHVIGHSMGGFIVQLLGIHYRNRIYSMTSISSSTNSPKVPLPPEKTWEIYLSSNPQNNFEKDLDGFLRVWEHLNGTAKFDKELAVEYTKNLYERQDIDGALGATHVKAQETLTDRSEELKKVKIPTLVIHGEEDYAVDKYGGINTAESIKDAELILIPKMGHIPFNHEILKRFENEIIRFIIKNKKCSR
ncbi:MAG: alpha/beta fold hydrolase [Cyclobacteriaceae bacterium]|nr:alpha/beta fold hydrolase [Cyclobacteriaceae bacterium]